MKKNDSLIHYFLKRKSLIKKSLVVSFIFSILLIAFNSVEKPFIAKLYIEGIIDSDSEFIDELNKIEGNSNFKGLLVIINSPGGTFVSSKEIYDSLQKKNQFDQHDVAATVLGGVSFSLVIKLDAINFGSEAKRKKKKRKKQKK